MIYYFSPNGNSRFVAEQLAASLGDEPVEDLSPYVLGQRQLPDSIEGRLILVFPIHAWYAPLPILSVVRAMSARYTDVYKAAICTAGSECGKGMKRFRHDFNYDAAWSIIMPNTYIPLSDIDSDAVAQSKVDQSHQRIVDISASIQAERRGIYDVLEGPLPHVLTYVLNPLFHRFCVNHRRFKVSDQCVSCGHCVKACPMHNIRLADSTSGKRPVWGDRCMTCMACVHQCPQRAIDYANTKRRGRYDLKKYLR